MVKLYRESYSPWILSLFSKVFRVITLLGNVKANLESDIKRKI